MAENLYRLATDLEKSQHPGAFYWRSDTKTWHTREGYEVRPLPETFPEFVAEVTGVPPMLAEQAVARLGLSAPASEMAWGGF